MGLNLKYAEGQTPIDEEERAGLKIKSISTQSELDEFEQLNIEKAVEWTIHSNLKSKNIFSEKFIKDLHRRMYGDVWRWAGEFRRSDKNIGVKWTRISIELKKLIDDAEFWINEGKMSAEEVALSFKHRIVSIHCFPNGNGRHSRIMADIIMESVFGKDIFTWHQSKMIKADKTRKEYISALKKAAIGDLKPLIDFAKN